MAVRLVRFCNHAGCAWLLFARVLALVRLELADLDLKTDVISGVTTNYSVEDFNTVRSSANNELQARLESSLEIEEVFKVLENFGVHAPPQELENLASLMLRFTTKDGRAYPSRSSVQNLYVHTLYLANAPLSADDIANRVQENDSDAGASPRNAVACLGRTKEVLHYDHGLWIHQRGRSHSSGYGHEVRCPRADARRRSASAHARSDSGREGHGPCRVLQRTPLHWA